MLGPQKFGFKCLSNNRCIRNSQELALFRGNYRLAWRADKNMAPLPTTCRSNCRYQKMTYEPRSLYNDGLPFRFPMNKFF